LESLIATSNLEVRGEFIIIVFSLTALVAAISDNRQPTSATTPEPYQLFDDPAYQCYNLVLNAIVTVLVRDAKVVAAVARHPRPAAPPSFASEISALANTLARACDLPKV
jgi:hypothetical protein